MQNSEVVETLASLKLTPKTQRHNRKIFNFVLGNYKKNIHLQSARHIYTYIYIYTYAAFYFVLTSNKPLKGGL